MKFLLTASLFLGIMTHVSQTQAQSSHADLEKALAEIKLKKYEAAIARVQPLLDGLRLNTVEEIINAHKALGIANCEIGDQPKAIEHFKTLVTFSPNEPIDEYVSSRPCADLYANIQAGKDPQTIAAPSPLVNTPDETRTLAMSAKKTGSYEGGRWKRYMPFGVGQFANDETTKGWAFLSTETLAVGSAVGFFFLFKSEKNDDGTFSNPSLASAYRGAYWGSVGLGAAVAIWGIVDAVRVHNQLLEKQSQARLSFDGAFLTYRF